MEADSLERKNAPDRAAEERAGVEGLVAGVWDFIGDGLGHPLNEQRLFKPGKFEDLDAPGNTFQENVDCLFFDLELPLSVDLEKESGSFQKAFSQSVGRGVFERAPMLDDCLEK